MDFFALNMFGGSAGAASGESGTGGNGFSMIILLVVMVGVMYLTMIRPQKKRQKEERAMRDNLQIGDEVTTIGGIMGRVVTVKEDSVIIETGADRTKLRFTRTAIAINNTAQEKMEAEREAAKKAQEEAKAGRASSAAKERKKSRKKDSGEE
ncbi:MAG: preprotein translocase subunit YajC [Oscillospiraceae bacterium]|jgi:preprotein translocase subunit YajC|nr:preprotein translocase subunit YajC [Oscillospiraceae bacterium]